MTSENRRADSDGDEPYLIVAALADGERVEPAALRAALEDGAVREYLADLIALRQAVGAAGELAAGSAPSRHMWGARARWLTTAAALVVSLAAGYLAGQRTADLSAEPSTIETVVDLGSAPVAPKPTRVVPLRPGVNWTETAGGR